jgi:predicted permease
MLHDIRLALRAFRQHFGFAAFAALIVALGAGANASVFSVVRAVLIDPLPYARPDELVSIWPDGFISNADLDFLRTRARSFVEIGATSPGWTTGLLGAGEPRRITATKTTANMFEMLGVAPALGRTFRRDEDRPGSEDVVILSDALWRSVFHGDPHVLGRFVTIEEQRREIIGVMGPDFELLGRDADVWLPLPFDRASPFWKGSVAQGIARLRDGVTIDAAGRELQALVPQWRSALGYQQDWGRDATIAALKSVAVGDVRRPLLVLLAAVGLIVLLTAANLGTLLLGRHVARRRELAVRGALGASMWRLVRQTATESLVLALAGAAAGIAAARLTLPLLIRLLPPDMPRVPSIALDPVVLAAVIVASIASVLLLGVLPSLLAVRPSLQPLLRLGAQSETRAGRRTLDLLVVAQVALAIVLGAGAALMGRSVLALQRVNPGFDADHVLTLKLQPGADRIDGIDSAVAYYDAMAASIERVPGVAQVAAINHLPLSGYNWVTGVVREDRPLPPGVSPPTAGWRMIDGPYFETMGIPVIAWRTFTQHDTRESPGVAIISEPFARRFFDDPADAIGRTVLMTSPRDVQPVQVVGVVGGVRHLSLASAPEPELYRPYAQSFPMTLAIVARTSVAPGSLIASVRQAVWDVDASAALADLLPLRTLLRDSLDRPRLIAVLLLAFAVIGLAVVLSGVYGVVAYSARRREREIGIRLAVGAGPASLVWLVVRQGALYAATGLLVGVPAALALTAFMRSLLFGVRPHDPATIAGLSALIVASTLTATLIPALRVRRVDPAAVLRAE